MYCIASLLPVAANATPEQEWRFKVYLDGEPVGSHNFIITQTGEDKKLSTRATFDVTFLKIPLFKYRHENVEYWNKQCLKSIASKTDQNGDLFHVLGTITDDGFQLSTNEGDATLPGCISTFAYWDKSFLQHDRLLNSQTGEYLEVQVDDLGEQTITVGDTSMPARRYKLTAEQLDIELWYSSNDHWLALQSTTSSGRVLRYVID